MKKLVFGITMLAMGTAYGAIRPIVGKVTLKIDPSHVQVNLGHQLQQGEEVAIYKQTCEGPKVKLCRKELVGMGVVSKVLNEKASEIQVDQAMAVQDGFIVEKK